MPARPARNAGATGTTYGPATIRKTARHRSTASGKTATDSSACPRLSMSAAIHQQLPDTLDLHALRLAPSVDVRRSLQARPRTARQRSHFTRREPSFGDRVVPFSYVHSSDRFGCVRCGSSCASVTQPDAGHNVPDGLDRTSGARHGLPQVRVRANTRSGMSRVTMLGAMIELSDPPLRR